MPSIGGSSKSGTGLSISAEGRVPGSRVSPTASPIPTPTKIRTGRR